MINKYFSLVILLFLFTAVHSQSTEDIEVDKKYTPYELLSSYYENDFNPFKKGNFYFGIALSLEDRQMENTEGLFQKTIDGKRVNFDILLKGGYYLNDYSMVGLNVNIYENKFEGDIYREPDTLQSNSITRGFSLTPNFRTTVPLTANERFSFFTTAGVTLGRSNTLKRDTKNLDEIDKSFAENYNLRVGITPGVTFFAMENFALEVGLDVLGYELNVQTKTVNDVSESRDIRHNIDFKLNLLTVKIGLAYYFKTKKNA